MPFAVIVSQDIFQRKLDDVYRNIPNVTGIADDIIVCGSTEEDHDQAFVRMLEASRANNVGLNSEKMQFKKQQVNFFGHTLTPYGVVPIRDKLEAIKSISAPTNSKELLSLLVMITYLNRFSARIATLTAPLRELTKKNARFQWNQSHQAALDQIKKELCKAQVLSYYDPDPSTTTILQCDASQEGLGAWLHQIGPEGEEKVVAMASRSLTSAESRYSNIERECLAVMYGLEKFEFYLLGRHTVVETDHSPLEQIFKKNIAEAPARLQRLLLRCLKFDIQVQYKRGESIPVADGLSRVCRTENTKESKDCEYDVHFLTEKTCPIDTQSVRNAVQEDRILNLLKKTIYSGWPPYRRQCPSELWEYWNYRCDLVLEDGLILKGNRVIVPETLRMRVLEVIHEGHQGETKCLHFARQSVFWPGISNDIRQMVKGCDVCNKHQSAQPKLPAMQPDLPTRPWQKLGTDIFEYNGSKYLLIVDYYSRFPVIRLLTNMSATTISSHFTSVFAEYGLPSTILADFGSQYVSEHFREKCKQSGIMLTFSSPYHHQANSLAEKSVGTCKHLWSKAQDAKQCPYTALWMYRITPLDDNLPSPYELLFGRQPRSLLPNSKSSLQPKHPKADEHQSTNQQRQDKQTAFYNQHVRRDKEELRDSQNVYVWNTHKKVWEPGKVLSRPNAIREPRTYVVEMNDKLYRRTRQHIRPRGDSTDHVTKPRPLVQNCPTPEEQESDYDVKEETVPWNDKDVESPEGDQNPCDHEVPAGASTADQDNPAEQGTIVVKARKTSFQPRSQVTRSGRVTKVPAKFKD